MIDNGITIYLNQLDRATSVSPEHLSNRVEA